MVNDPPGRPWATASPTVGHPPTGSGASIVAGRIQGAWHSMPTDAIPLPWSEVRRRLRGRPERELLRIIGDCYKASAEVRERLTLDLLEGPEERERAIARYRHRLSQAFWAQDRRGAPVGPDLRTARDCVLKVGSLAQEPGTAIDVMLDYVEHGVGFTCEYGDFWEGYYDAVEGMFLKARDALLADRDRLDVARIVARMEAIVGGCSYCGYGFKDNLDIWMEELREELDKGKALGTQRS